MVGYYRPTLSFVKDELVYGEADAEAAAGGVAAATAAGEAAAAAVNAQPAPR